MLRAQTAISRFRIAGLVSAAALLIGAAPTGVQAAQAVAETAAHSGVMIPAHAGQALPKTNADESSLNWAGYAVTRPSGSKITAVHSTFKVPAMKDTTPGFSAAWTGIGGYDTNDLIQAGVEANAPSTVFGYGAWYEMLPDAETPISGCTSDPACTVAPGDTFTVDITETSAGSNVWRISMSDSRGWTFNKQVNYTSTHSSAEWILEAPTVIGQTVLPMMDTTHFAPTNTYSLDGGPARTIASGNPVSIDLLTVEATPSPLRSDGQSFDVCDYSLSCP